MTEEQLQDIVLQDAQKSELKSDLIFDPVSKSSQKIALLPTEKKKSKVLEKIIGWGAAILLSITSVATFIYRDKIFQEVPRYSILYTLPETNTLQKSNLFDVITKNITEAVIKSDLEAKVAKNCFITQGTYRIDSQNYWVLQEYKGEKNRFVVNWTLCDSFDKKIKIHLNYPGEYFSQWKISSGDYIIWVDKHELKEGQEYKYQLVYNPPKNWCDTFVPFKPIR